LRTREVELGSKEGIILSSFARLSVRCQSPRLDPSGDSQRRLEPASRTRAPWRRDGSRFVGLWAVRKMKGMSRRHEILDPHLATLLERGAVPDGIAEAVRKPAGARFYKRAPGEPVRVRRATCQAFCTEAEAVAPCEAAPCVAAVAAAVVSL
jgi:hypothetical protein